MQAMERTDYNITKSAKLLGLNFRTLQYRLEKFGIKKDGDGTRKRKNRNLRGGAYGMVLDIRFGSWLRLDVGYKSVRDGRGSRTLQQFGG